MQYLTKHLLDNQQAWLINFIKWYKVENFVIPAGDFLEYPVDNQIGVYLSYIEQKHNVGILADPHAFVLYWINIEHKVAEADIKERYKTTGIFSHHFYSEFNLRKKGVVDAFARGIMKVASRTIEPF